jgi:hypothetical protein
MIYSPLSEEVPRRGGEVALLVDRGARAGEQSGQTNPINQTSALFTVKGI